MNCHASDIAFMQGFALRSAYLKTRMNVPKFGDANGAPHDTATDLHRIADVRVLPQADFAYAAANSIALVAAIGALTVLPLRWEPRNTIVTHAAIPRPGGGECCSRLYLNLPDKDGAIVMYRYEPDIPGLVETDTAAAVGETRPTLSIIADMARIAYSYGEFSLTLAALETGHCAGQIASLFAALGLPLQWCEPPAAHRPDGRSQFHLRTLELPTADWLDAVRSLPQSRSHIRSPRESAYCARHFPAMARAGILIEEGRCTIGQAPSLGPIATEELIAAAARRSSGIEGQGYAPRSLLDAVGLAAMLDDWRRLAAPSGFGATVGLRFHLATFSIKGFQAQFAEFHLADGAWVQRGERNPAPLLKPHIGLGFGYNLEAFTMAIAIAAPIAGTIERWGPRGYAEMLAQAGAIGQAFLNAAALAGLFARPYRAYNEAQLEQVFDISDQIIYLILCGAERIPNPSFRLTSPFPDVP